MKKNNMLRIASVLLVAVLLSTCAISGAFAKYVTDSGDPVTDTGRVAKWGVTVQAAAGEGFKTTYEAEEGKDYASTITNTVVGTTLKDAQDAAIPGSDKVVAPGTSGSLGGITMTGTPEVAVNVKSDVTLELEGWEVDGNFYCPIIFTIGTAAPINGADYFNRHDDLISAVKEAIATNDSNYAAGTNLSTLNANYSWAWAFEGDNAKDTALGNQAAGVDGGVAATISLTVKTTVTQLD